jgi:phage FluMu protein Com
MDESKAEVCEFCGDMMQRYETLSGKLVARCPQCLFRKHFEAEVGWVIDEWPICEKCGTRVTGVDAGAGGGWAMECPVCKVQGRVKVPDPIGQLEMAIPFGPDLAADSDEEKLLDDAIELAGNLERASVPESIPLPPEDKT